jgi:hypothetical protein
VVCSVGPPPGCSGNRFYGPGVDTKRGDGKNLAPLPHHLPCCADSCCQFVAFLPPSSFGSRYGRANNKTPSSESVVRQTQLRSSLVSQIHGPSARVHSRLREMAVTALQMAKNVPEGIFRGKPPSLLSSFRGVEAVRPIFSRRLNACVFEHFTLNKSRISCVKRPM